MKYWLPVYLYAGLIFFYSSLSSPPVLLPKILYADKLFHLLEYAILGYFIARAARNSANLQLSAHFRIFAVFLAVLYGLTDELHQCFVPGRKVEILDVLADGAGALLGQLFAKG